MSAKSDALYARASRYIPGGVNSPVRAWRQVGGTPRFIVEGDGAFVTDADGARYIDYVGSWGPLILGHRNRRVEQAIEAALRQGTSFGAPTPREVEFAELLCTTIPGLEMVRLVSSGTEATMSLIRLARAFTGRKYIIKFNGCYHGHSDSLLVKAGSGIATFGISGSAGVPDEVAALTLSVKFNDLAVVQGTVEQVGADNIAAVLVEPVPGNMGLIPPRPGYLEGLRDLCKRHGILLIFDEVMSGFRVGPQGAVGRFGITPDLLALGKVVGGGLPLAAFGGRADIMSLLAPLGPVYQAGTLSGNPLAVSAGLETVRLLQELNPYESFEARARELTEGVESICQKHHVPCRTEHCGAMWGFFISAHKVEDFEAAKESDTQFFNKLFHALIERGVYLPPSPFEACFLGTCHDGEIIEATLRAFDSALASLAS